MSTTYDPARVASHLSVLKYFSDATHVLEFGQGETSTNHFLSLPGLKKLVTYECDPEWAKNLDPDRHTLIVMSEAESLGHCFQHFPNRFFDVALVDGKTREMRLPSAIVASRLSSNVVVHDTEKECYAPIFDYFEMAGWKHHTYKPTRGHYYPYTTLFSQYSARIMKLVEFLYGS